VTTTDDATARPPTAAAASMARLFVAATPAGEQLRRLAELRSRITVAMPATAWRWNAPSDLHVTLRFLGNTPSAAIAALGPRLDAIAARHACCTLGGGAVQAWANRRASLLVVEFPSTPQLDALVDELEQQARDLGYAPETRPYRPHVTLARGRLPPGTDVPHIDCDGLACDIDALDLYVSNGVTLPRRYRRLHRAPLAPPAAAPAA